VIEKVERFQPKINLLGLGEGTEMESERLDQSEIHVDISRPAQEVSAGITVGAECRSRECAGVEPASPGMDRNASTRPGIGIPYEIRAIIGSSVLVGVDSGQNGKREPSMTQEDSAHRPTPKNVFAGKA